MDVDYWTGGFRKLDEELHFLSASSLPSMSACPAVQLRLIDVLSRPFHSCRCLTRFLK